MISKLLLGISFAALAFAAEDVVTAVEGTVKKVDAGSKTVVVATADGTEHTVHFVKKTSVEGWDASEAGAEDGMHGVKEGSHRGGALHGQRHGKDRAGSGPHR